MNTHPWAIFGKWLGYPDCCIQDFIKLKPLNMPKRKLNGSGYIPCTICNEKTEEALISAINGNRQCTIKFPHHPGMNGGK